VHRKRLADPINQRYRSRCRGFERSPARGLREREDRSRLDGKASALRIEQALHVQRRKVFLTWATDHAAASGAVIPVKQSRMGATVRFSNVNPAVSFGVRAERISVNVSVCGRWDLLADFESEPVKVTGGYIDDRLLPQYQTVHADLHTLWLREVFEHFQRWYAEQFAVATELIVDHDVRTGSLSVALYPGKVRALMTNLLDGARLP
jgi:hypothetical protein